MTPTRSDVLRAAEKHRSRQFTAAELAQDLGCEDVEVLEHLNALVDEKVLTAVGDLPSITPPGPEAGSFWFTPDA